MFFLSAVCIVSVIPGRIQNLYLIFLCGWFVLQYYFHPVKCFKVGVHSQNIWNHFHSQVLSFNYVLIPSSKHSTYPSTIAMRSDKKWITVTSSPKGWNRDDIATVIIYSIALHRNEWVHCVFIKPRATHKVECVHSVAWQHIWNYRYINKFHTH